MKSYADATIEFQEPIGLLSRQDRESLAENRKTARRLEMAEREAAVAQQQAVEAQRRVTSLRDIYAGARNGSTYLLCYVRLPNGTRCPEPAVHDLKLACRCHRHQFEKAEIED